LAKVQSLRADQVLVTVGTVCSVSAVGSTETFRARARGEESWLGYAAFDAGLASVERIQGPGGAAPQFRSLDGAHLSISEIERKWGERLRQATGIRPLVHASAQTVTDLAAELPHDWEAGGFRAFAGLGFDQIRQSAFRDMFGLFDDDPALGPSLQSQLFLYAGIGALAALPVPLAKLVREARFRLAAAAAFPGLEALRAMEVPMQSTTTQGGSIDKLAYRLSSSLGTHGAALLATMLAPPYNLSKVQRDPSLLAGLRQADDAFSGVPHAPLVSSGACASALINFCDLASQMMLRTGPVDGSRRVFAGRRLCA
jgi:3-oxoacyl-[acyl-carrier-protein] synthase II